VHDFFTLKKYTLQLRESLSTYTIVVEKILPFPFFTLIKYTLPLVESLATYAKVVYNLLLLYYLLHLDKLPTSASRNRATSILFNNIHHDIPTYLGESQTTLISHFNNIQFIPIDRRRFQTFTALAHFYPS